jgi:transposase InsO family protein
VAENRRAENTLEALQRALKTRNKRGYEHQLIHHSDRGGQYISESYTQALEEAQIRIRICNEVYENAQVERVNGTIKNQYLIHWNITNFQQLQAQLKRAVNTYNQHKPQAALKGRTPEAFEQYIKELNESQRPKLSIWTASQSQNTNPNQCVMQF